MPSLIHRVGQVAVREAYATIVASANHRIDRYLEEHPSGRGRQIDRRAWALASYKLTYDMERFSPYLKIDWKAVDAELFGDEEENDEIEETLRALAGAENGSSEARRFSFAWLLAQDVFALLEAP